MKPKALIVRTAGINCDIETKHALECAGAKADLVHTNEITQNITSILSYDILVFPGGFSYGDDIAGGKIWSLHMKKVYQDIKSFIDSGRPVIGICNGFQVLTKLGFLPENKSKEQTLSLTFNDNGKFIAKWEKLKVNKKSPCLFTKNLDDIIELPIAHGEGKVVIDNDDILKKLNDNNSIALTYESNPNGSIMDIAGICNTKGNCFGLMPHPERYISNLTHPARTRKEMQEIKATGLTIFKNAVNFVK